MTAPLALPQARVPLGYVMVGGQRMPVQIDIEWMRALLGLLDRTGGTSGNTSAGSGLDELLPFLMAPTQQDPAAQDALRAVDELRNEIASTRAELHRLEGQIEDALSQLGSLGVVNDLTGRVAQIEDRLQ